MVLIWESFKAKFGLFPWEKSCRGVRALRSGDSKKLAWSWQYLNRMKMREVLIICLPVSYTTIRPGCHGIKAWDEKLEVFTSSSASIPFSLRFCLRFFFFNFSLSFGLGFCSCNFAFFLSVFFDVFLFEDCSIFDIFVKDKDTSWILQRILGFCFAHKVCAE